MALGVAFRAFFAALTNQERSEAIRQVLDIAPERLSLLKIEPPVVEAKPPTPKPTPIPKPPARSEALTLLAMLQRESRLIDLIQEPLDQFPDAQVGAAARPCLNQCRQTLARVFNLQPLIDGPENSSVDVPGNASAIRYQWVGSGATEGAKSGRLVHPGWQASHVELAKWTGGEADALVVAPVELER